MSQPRKKPRAKKKPARTGEDPVRAAFDRASRSDAPRLPISLGRPLGTVLAPGHAAFVNAPQRPQKQPEEALSPVTAPPVSRPVDRASKILPFTLEISVIDPETFVIEEIIETSPGGPYGSLPSDPAYCATCLPGIVVQTGLAALRDGRPRGR